MILILFMSFVVLCGCGVKGDPQPPTVPPPIGRGQPTFKDAVKGVQTTPVPATASEEENDEQN